MDIRLGNSIVLIIVLVSLFGCKKPEERRCVKSIGEEIVETLVPGDFDRLYLGPHIKFTLVQDTSDFLILKGGKNLLPFIETELVDGRLAITNTNKCNFLRSFKKEIEVEIHFDYIYNIEFNGTLELTCANTVISDYFSLTLDESAGKFNLDLNASSLRLLVQLNSGNFNISGEVNYLQVQLNGTGFGNTENMIVNDSLHVLSKSNGDVYINAANTYLRAQTSRGGDIYYIGNPDSIDYHKFGEGELIDNN